MRKYLVVLGLIALYGGLFAVSVWQGLRLVPDNQVVAVDVCSEDSKVCVGSEIEKREKVKDIKKYDKKTLAASKGNLRKFTYSVTTKGIISASLAEFKAKASATLNNAQGWGEVASFSEVNSGGDFTLVLSEAKYLPSFSTGCSANWSCRAGRFVIINQDRWLGASSAWNASGGSLRDYQHMVVNHEVGHWLGFGHSSCGGSGQKAPVMQQQSISLQGCKFNPWPIASEISQLK